MGVANHLILQEIGIYYPPHESTSNIGQHYGRFLQMFHQSFLSPKQKIITPLEDYRKSKGCTKEEKNREELLGLLCFLRSFSLLKRYSTMFGPRAIGFFCFGIFTKQQYSVPARTAQP